MGTLGIFDVRMFVLRMSVFSKVICGWLVATYPQTSSVNVSLVTVFFCSPHNQQKQDNI